MHKMPRYDAICLLMLVASRRVAESDGGWTDKGCAVLKSGDYFFVEGPQGVMAWEGSAHCRYCARTEAITQLSDPQRLKRYEALVAKHGRVPA